MISKLQKPIRVFGQLSIDSTFRKLPSDSSTSSNDLKGNEGRQASHKSIPFSLSDFLDRKLQKSSVVLGRIQGKPTPFLSPLGLGISEVKDVGTIEQVDKETKSISDRVIFEKFKHNDEEKGDFIGPSGVNETENSVEDDMQESRKRKNAFAGLSENQTVKRQVVILGGESTRKQIRRTTAHSSSNKRPRPLYNHYKNGCGWWDCDMEGVDNEEVGFHEVWEGVGSASLGEIVDWH
ncbi:uncharacterized protein LOC129308280 [Prosopis cineraria]|uniref:uncharacterized protein LOC129308280 n=1 Tax=Prosopis cineraria TaxID=364024 RepID=UPI00240F780C|nr:uncharacterized protein LOC129308280 [Prosopis cineraria]